MAARGTTDCESFRALTRAEKERLFLEILATPPLKHRGSWGEWLHAWLEDQTAAGRSLGVIAARMDFPNYEDAEFDEPWEFLERHVCWLIERGCARVIRVEPLM